jgi:predicted NAD-dependent protein-ADP-ribosyltransferase YbiA (DUF1768 family)
MASNTSNEAPFFASHPIIVTGGRDFDFIPAIYDFLDKIHLEKPVDLLIHGGARGADSVADSWALDRGIKTHVFTARWEDGKAAGPKRNSRMLNSYPAATLVSFPGGAGTRDCTSKALKMGLKVIYFDLILYPATQEMIVRRELKKNLYEPTQEGITHINAYSRSGSDLGRFLSNFAQATFKTPFGPFLTIEGYWYYLRFMNSGAPDHLLQSLKNLSGENAKRLGKELEKNFNPWNELRLPERIFRDLIAEAIILKLLSAPENIVRRLKEISRLPLVHYYIFNNAPVHGGYDWWVELMEEIIMELTR